MKKYFVTILAIVLSFGIFSCDPLPKLFVKTGVVIDTTMNNIMVLADEGDTLNISTMDTDSKDVPSVMIDDKITVTYIIQKVENGEINKAVKLVIDQHSPLFYIAGTWVEPNPIKPTEMQGVTLNADGTASSVNMATLVFKSWVLSNSQLLLNSESIGNKQTIVGTDTMKIIKLDTDSLVLDRKGGTVWRLAREKK